MKHFPLVSKVILTILLIAGTTGFSSERKLPLVDGKETIATVNGEPITLEEFNRALGSLHAERAGEKPTGGTDYSALLSRLITTRLIVLEARNIGLDELPEIKDMVDGYARKVLIRLLLERHVKTLKADSEEVDRLYKEAVREWKIKSVILEKEDGAKKVERELKGDGNFDRIAKRLIAEGEAKGTEHGEYVKDKDLFPQVAAAVSQMEVGSVSPIIPIESGFVILKLEDTRFPENPGERERARQVALDRKKSEATEDYYMALKRKYVKVYQEVLDRLDFESEEPGFQKLLEDRHIVAKVKRQKPVTVGELAEGLKEKFYHGIERAIAGGEVNRSKIDVLEEILRRRLFRNEALRQRVDRTEEYESMVREYENSALFGIFIQKVVVPDIKLKETELKTYYREHAGEYSYPEMMRIYSLVFATRKAAENAMDKLEEGVDFGWLSSNAEGQVDMNTTGVLRFDGKLLMTRSLPEEVRNALSRARTGDFRLYESPEGHFSVLYVQGMLPSKPKPFEKAREGIAKKVFSDKIKKAVKGWADKLREVYEVEIYATDLRT